MTKPIQPTHTGAFYLQAVISFALAFLAVGLGIAYLPADAWVRGFLAVGVLYLVTATFMLAKVVRDRQELSTVATRVDQARLDKLLAAHDPFKVDD